MTTDPNSCICKKCKVKNENIEYMIQAISDTKIGKAEQVYYDHYKKNQSQPGDKNYEPVQPDSYNAQHR
jgi:hypothetical protein